MSAQEIWGRFTNPATRVVYFAQVESKAQGVTVVGTEHLLLGLVREEEGVAARVLLRFGVDLARARAEFTRSMGKPTWFLNEGKLTLSLRGKRALQYALEESQTLADHRGIAPYVDTEHLLLGLLRLEESCNGCAILRGLHVDASRLREELYRAAAGRIPPRPTYGPIFAIWHPSAASIFSFFNSLLARKTRQHHVPNVETSTPPVPNAFDTFMEAATLLDGVLIDAYRKIDPDEEPAACAQTRQAVLIRHADALAKTREGFAQEYQYPPFTELIFPTPYLEECRRLGALFLVETEEYHARARYACAVQSCLDGIRYSVTLPRNAGVEVFRVSWSLESQCLSMLKRMLPNLDAKTARETLARLHTLDSLRTPLADVLRVEVRDGARRLEAEIAQADALRQHPGMAPRSRELMMILAHLSPERIKPLLHLHHRFWQEATIFAQKSHAQDSFYAPFVPDPDIAPLFDYYADRVTMSLHSAHHLCEMMRDVQLQLVLHGYVPWLHPLLPLPPSQEPGRGPATEND